MKSIIESAELCLKEKNLFAELLQICLSLPDICGKLENKSISSSRYIEWFEKYLDNYKGYLNGNDCYALRCAVVHEGTDDITEQKKKSILQKFIFITKGAHLNRFSNSTIGSNAHDGKELLQISVDNFCIDIFLQLKNGSMIFKKTKKFRKT